MLERRQSHYPPWWVVVGRTVGDRLNRRTHNWLRAMMECMSNLPSSLHTSLTAEPLLDSNACSKIAVASVPHTDAT